MKTTKAARMAMSGVIAVGLALSPGTAGAADASYAEAIRCAAVTSVVAGILEAGEPSPDDKQSSADFQKMAEYWLTSAVGANPKGQDAAFADFDKASTELTDQIVRARTADEVSAVLTHPLQVCATFDNPMRKSDPVKAS